MFSAHDFPHFIYIILFLIMRLACGCLCFICEAFYIFSWKNAYKLWKKPWATAIKRVLITEIKCSLQLTKCSTLCEFFFCCYNHFKGKEGSSVLFCAVLSIPSHFVNFFSVFHYLFVDFFLTGAKNTRQKIDLPPYYRKLKYALRTFHSKRRKSHGN